MGSFSTAKAHTLALLISLFISISVSGHQFEVGGEIGWTRPQGNETETYNEWAEQNRFHIGDTIYFRYQDDAVLVVSKDDYESCNGSNPIERFDEGGAVFEFNRHGFFYFISESQENCEMGQRIIIRVMVQAEYHPNVAPAPSPVEPTSGGDRGGYGWPSGSGSVAFSSGNMVAVSSYLVTAITGVFFVL